MSLTTFYGKLCFVGAFLYDRGTNGMQNKKRMLFCPNSLQGIARVHQQRQYFLQFVYQLQRIVSLVAELFSLCLILLPPCYNVRGWVIQLRVSRKSN